MPSQNSSGSMVSTSPVLARAMTSSPQAAGLRLSSATEGPSRQVSRPAMSLRKSRSTVGAASTAWRTVLSSSSTTRRVSSISPRVLHSTRTAIATPLVFEHPHIPQPAQSVARVRRRHCTCLPSTSPRPQLGPRAQGKPGFPAGALEKGGDDLLEKDILVQENRAFGYFPPGHGVAPQHIIPLPHEEVHLIVQPVAVDNKPARHLHFVALYVDDPHVGNDVADARHRLLAPVDTGVDLADPSGQDSLALVDPRDLCIRVRVLPVPLTELHVAPYGHVIVDVVGDQLYPVAVPPVIEQLRLHVEELLDLTLQEQALQGLLQVTCRQGHGCNPFPLLDHGLDVGEKDHVLLSDSRGIVRVLDNADQEPSPVARVAGHLENRPIPVLH